MNFGNDVNKNFFLKQFSKYLSDKISIFAFCLMDNHYHLVIRLNDDGKIVTQAFSNFFNSYAKAFNKENGRTGSLFEKHFKRIKLNDEEYLKEKVKAGVDAVQIFDSWGGMLSPVDYQEFSWKYINQIVEALADETHVIVFGKGCWFALGEMGKSRASALGVDWTCSARNARYLSGGNITLQGNFDPSRLLSPIPVIKKMVHQMIDEFGKDKYIANLGHGILPNIPVDHAKAFVDAVKEYQK